MFINFSISSRALDSVVFSPKAIIFASLSFLVASASSILSTFAQRIPFTLLQAILIPIPVPQIAIPKSAF